MERRFDAILGNSQRLDGGSMFGNAPRALWQRWAPPDDQHRIGLACRAMLVREPGRTLLFETGIGAFFEPAIRQRFGVVEAEHVLLDQLRGIGVDESQIDLVVLSHLHFDHAGGLLTAWREGQAAALHFPRARYVVGRAAWDRARAPHLRDRASFVPELQALLEASGRLELIDEDNTDLLGPGYRFHRSDGHSPGMLLTEVEGREAPILFCGDLIPGRSWVRTAITMGYDRFPERLIDEKTRLLEDLLSRGGRLFFTHDPDCALATLGRDESGRVVVRETWAELADTVL